MDQAMEALQALMPKIRSEPDTVEYTVYRGLEDPNLVVFIEQCKSPEALAAHMASDELQACVKVATRSLDGEPVMGNLEVVASAR